MSPVNSVSSSGQGPRNAYPLKPVEEKAPKDAKKENAGVLKESAAFWANASTGSNMPASEVTARDIIGTLGMAAFLPAAVVATRGLILPLLHLACANNLNEAVSSGGKNTKIQKFGLNATKGLGEPQLVNLKEGLQDGSSIEFSWEGNVFEDVNSMEMLIGTMNANAVKKLIEDEQACVSGNVSGCAERSCRVVNAGASVEPLPGSTVAAEVVDGTHINVPVFGIDPVAPEDAQRIGFYGPREVIVKFGGVLYESVNSVDVEESNLGLSIPNVEFEFDGTDFLSDPNGVEAVYVFDRSTGMCNFGETELQNLYVGESGAHPLNWWQITRDYGRRIINPDNPVDPINDPEQLPEPALMYIYNVELICHSCSSASDRDTDIFGRNAVNVIDGHTVYPGLKVLSGDSIDDGKIIKEFTDFQSDAGAAKFLVPERLWGKKAGDYADMTAKARFWTLKQQGAGPINAGGYFRYNWAEVNGR